MITNFHVELSFAQTYLYLIKKPSTESEGRALALKGFWETIAGDKRQGMINAIVLLPIRANPLTYSPHRSTCGAWRDCACLRWSKFRSCLSVLEIVRLNLFLFFFFQSLSQQRYYAHVQNWEHNMWIQWNHSFEAILKMKQTCSWKRGGFGQWFSSRDIRRKMFLANWSLRRGGLSSRWSFINGSTRIV